ncbi:MAG: NAD(P)-dependent glycerol-1-phosphate dehydrogenase, partial [Methanothrix sp.]|nr:NAD(P)-dependent glycerol-1-phosphate dehydrogenase [Methanothrix sp.]
CGLGTIVMMYLHGGDWKMIKRALDMVAAPTSAVDLGLDPEAVISALVSAHEIRPERYTILDAGLSRTAAVRAAEATGII